MTIDHPVRRLLARLCSHDTMTTVVDPTLADARWEAGRPTWLAYYALFKALSVHAVTSTPGVISRAYSDDGRAVPRVGAYTMAGAVAFAVLVNVLPTVSAIRRAPSTYPFVQAFLLQLPPTLILTLPAALLIAIPLTLNRQILNARLARRVAVLSAVFAAITFALLIWVLPEANQAYRGLVSGNPGIARGRSEAGLAAARQEIGRLRTFEGGNKIVRGLEFRYHHLLALATAPVPLGLLALGLTRQGAGRRRPLLFSSGALAFYTCLILSFQWLRFLAVTSAIAPWLLAWLPHLVVALVAALLLARLGPTHLAPSTEH